MVNRKDDVADFLEAAIRDCCGFGDAAPLRVMDFGCGDGYLVDALARRRFEAKGCDLAPYWLEAGGAANPALGVITPSPYRLPFADGEFDVVVSTSVLEHARNKEECFREIHRVLRMGGAAIHLFPARWYLPREPHIHVPLANFWWPHSPRWWLLLWAHLGVRNAFQLGLSPDVVANDNLAYCREGLSYWTTSAYKTLSLRVFGNCCWPMQFYLERAPGGLARLLRNLPFKTLLGPIIRETRTTFLITRKDPGVFLQAK